MTAVRKIIGIPVTLLIALVAQVAVINRAPLPGDAGPDVVLLAVAGLGATLGPMTGLVAGFFGGLALDIMPPSGHLAGEYALVFCLAGYSCGRMRAFADPMEEHGTLTSVTVMALGAAGGEAARAALGLMLSDPDVTGPAVKHVLPGAILYDLLLTPFMAWLTVLAVGRRTRPNAPGPHRRPPRTAPQYGAVRVATAGSAPRLHLGGGPSAATPRSTVRREPRLRLAGSTSPALSRTGNGVWSSPASLAFPRGRRPVSPRFASAGGGLLGGGLPGGALGPSLFSGSPLRWSPLRGGAGRGGALRRAAGPGKGWLRAGKPSGAGGGAARGLAGSGPGRGWIKPSKPARSPHVKSPGKGWIKPARSARQARVHSPGKGWLKSGQPSSSAWRPRSPGRGWLKGSGALGKPTTYQSRSVPFRRRRGIRLGGRR